MAPLRILLLEDEPDPASLLVDFFGLNGLQVEHFLEGAHAWKHLATTPPDYSAAAILDVMVPGLSGLEVLANIRATPSLSHLPVLLLTARDQEAHELEALAHGADDYIAKPASLARVLARVQALLRRQPAPPQAASFFELLPQAIACRVESQRIPLTATEFSLLQLLTTHPGRVFTRQEMLESLGEEHQAVFDRTVDAHIKNLRHKLGPAARLLRTARGVGYSWEE